MPAYFFEYFEQPIQKKELIFGLDLIFEDKKKKP
jgi:hypothetical protein